MATRASLSRIHFFQKMVHMDEWKNTMAGDNEKPVISILESIGFILGKDFHRQYPIGEKFVMDFAFINEQVSLEVDGENHNTKRQKRLDTKRDKYLRDNNWISIRIKDSDITGTYKKLFYKNLIKDVVEERREQWEKGELFAIEVPNYKDEDYE